MFLGTDGSNVFNHMRFDNNNVVDNNGDKEEKGKRMKFNSLNTSQALECASGFIIIDPTVPDTTQAFSLQHNDNKSGSEPLVMQHMHNAYFVGNCMEYQTKMITNDNKK